MLGAGAQVAMGLGRVGLGAGALKAVGSMLNPFTLPGLLTYGTTAAGVLSNEGSRNAVAGLFDPTDIQATTIGRGRNPLNDQYKKGPAARLLDFIDGKDNYFGLDDASLETLERTKLIPKSAAYGDADFYATQGFLTPQQIKPREGDSVQSYTDRMSPLLKQAERDYTFKTSPQRIQEQTRFDENRQERLADKDANRSMLELNMMQNFNIRQDQAFEQVRAAKAAEQLQRLQLAQTDSQFNANLAYQREIDSRNRKDNLMNMVALLTQATFQ